MAADGATENPVNLEGDNVELTNYKTGIRVTTDAYVNTGSGICTGKLTTETYYKIQ